MLVRNRDRHAWTFAGEEARRAVVRADYRFRPMQEREPVPFFGGLIYRSMLALVVLVAMAACAGAAPTETADEARGEARALLEKGLDYLAANQGKDGSWRSHVGISALALASFLRNPVGENERYARVVEKGLAFLVSNAREDGGIHGGPYPTYSTALSVMALELSRRAEYEPLIKRAQRFLVSMQADEDTGMEPDSPSYGGVGYDGKKRPDLSNTHFAIEALRESGLPKDDPFFEKAVTFLERLQNRTESNDQPWSGDDGGFVYAPDESKAGEHETPTGEKRLRSYASMTYAGLLSYIYAGVSATDPRVQAAYEWIRRNYSLDENPGMGLAGLYYYYHTYAKTFAVLRKATVLDADGNAHDWRAELVGVLAAAQREDGSWVNAHSRWFETDPVLVTSYACIALSWCLAP